MTNPTATNAWQKLKNLQHEPIQALYQQNPNRVQAFALATDNLSINYTNTSITEKGLTHLIELANECNLRTQIEQLFQGESINTTENRPALHTALREQDHKLISLDVKNTLVHMQTLAANIDTGKWQGFSGKPITDIVNLGIGGSDLGPRFVTEALKDYQQKLNCHFVANVDADELYDVLATVNPETTLFIISSKSFTTPETLCNANSARAWLQQYTDQIDKHFIAVTANVKKACDYGIKEEYIFPMRDWVVGRCSLWSAVGLSIIFAIGFENFQKLLQGAYKVDQHFYQNAFERNMPVILGLIDIWHLNFCQTNNIAILPYSHRLKLLPSYLQQLLMESNGKRVTKNNEAVNYQTGAIIWGGEETNGQHAFHQLLFQGTITIPSDIIVVEQANHPHKTHQDLLLANAKAQAQALREGQHTDDIYRNIPGNQPNITIILPKLTPETLGALIALYEHRTFVQSAIWNINPFDQWGVELGKKLARNF